MFKNQYNKLQQQSKYNNVKIVFKLKRVCGEMFIFYVWQICGSVCELLGETVKQTLAQQQVKYFWRVRGTPTWAAYKIKSFHGLRISTNLVWINFIKCTGSVRLIKLHLKLSLSYVLHIIRRKIKFSNS